MFVSGVCLTGLPREVLLPLWLVSIVFTPSASCCVSLLKLLLRLLHLPAAPNTSSSNSSSSSSSSRPFLLQSKQRLAAFCSSSSEKVALLKQRGLKAKAAKPEPGLQRETLGDTQSSTDACSCCCGASTGADQGDTTTDAAATAAALNGLRPLLSPPPPPLDPEQLKGCSLAGIASGDDPRGLRLGWRRRLLCRRLLLGGALYFWLRFRENITEVVDIWRLADLLNFSL